MAGSSLVLWHLSEDSQSYTWAERDRGPKPKSSSRRYFLWSDFGGNFSAMVEELKCEVFAQLETTTFGSSGRTELLDGNKFIPHTYRVDINHGLEAR